jgi:hypothetical protein
MKQCSEETARRARNSETHKDAFVDMFTYSYKAERRGDQMGNRNSSYGELCSETYGTNKGVRMLPIPKPATEAMAPAKMAATAISVLKIM